MKRRGTLERAVLISVILLGAVLRMHRLGVDSLWYDETVSLLLAGKTIPAMIAHTARDIHPPAYYLVLNLWARLAGRTEFAAAWPSFAAGVLLIPAVYSFARRLLPNGLTLRGVPLLAAALVATSPFNIWYSQEVRMYTIGALVGVIGGYTAWRMLEAQIAGSTVTRSRSWWVFVITSAIGLYTLYYYAFLLVSLAIVIAVIVWRHRLSLRPWLLSAGATLLLWAPWIPIAYRQAVEPPVPPWRSLTPFADVLRESFTVLTFSHSMAPTEVAGWLPVALLLYIGGLAWLWIRLRDRSLSRFVPLLLVGWTWGAVLLIELFSVTLQPLYHPRYVFTYSPPFYIVLAAGLVGLAQSSRHMVRTGDDERLRFLPQLALLVLTLTAWTAMTYVSLSNFWYNTDYAEDDFRSAMDQLEARWYPGDALLVNAGYVYPAVDYYFQDAVAWQGRLSEYEQSEASAPEGLIVLQSGSLEGTSSLGWGRPDSDFYLSSPEETIDALQHVAGRHPRLWMLRAYDTVTDPDGIIRAWLANTGTLFYDERLTGESNIRLQGWLMPAAFEQTPGTELTAEFIDRNTGQTQIELRGYDRPEKRLVGGDTFDITLYVDPAPALAGEVRVSLGLFDADGRQWAVEDTSPLGPLTPLYALGARDLLPIPIRLDIPTGVPPGAYELRLKFYRPTSGQALLVSGETAANQEQVRLLAVPIRPTPADASLPTMQRTLDETAGPLRLLGATLPQEPVQVGQSADVELLWQIRGDVPIDLQPHLVADSAIVNGGGLAARMPTSEWPAQSLIRDIHVVSVQPDASPGEHSIKLQLLEGTRTLAWGGLIRSRDAIELGSLTVVDRPRSFTPPAIDTTVNALFGDAIELAGYTLEVAEPAPGGELMVTLAWHAQARPAGRYKVFTHLVGPDGTIRGQRDLEPGNGALPTNGWVADEYVTMEYAVPIDPDATAGTYELRIGLYDPDTGTRLPIQHPQANVQEHYLSLAAVEVGE